MPGNAEQPELERLSRLGELDDLAGDVFVHKAEWYAEGTEALFGIARRLPFEPEWLSLLLYGDHPEQSRCKRILDEVTRIACRPPGGS